MPTPYQTALVTVPDKKTAQKLAQGILKQKLAACVNIISGLESHYWWEGKIEKTQEFLLLIKTKQKLFSSLAQFVKENHPYTIPEIIAITIEEGHKPYLEWIGKETRGKF